MPNNRQLLCLIEGTRQPFEISIHPNSIGESLRHLIFDLKCRDLAPGHSNLTLLRVNLDPNNPETPLPLLRLNPHDKGVEEVSLWKKIHTIWQGRPPAHQIHVFVTFHNLPSGFQTRRGLLEAAYRLYYEFWGKALGTHLQPVPNSGGFVYLPQEKINHLQLRDWFFYFEDALLVRDEYEVAYHDLLSSHEDPMRKGSGVVVLGQSGIGKTSFLYYLLFRLLSEQRAVAFQVKRNFIVFQATQVLLCDAEDPLEAAFIPNGSWVLSDSRPYFEKPCSAFLSAAEAGNGWVVHTTSPPKDKWDAWQSVFTPYWMDVFTLDELSALGNILRLDTNSLCNNYNLWGPFAGLCILLTRGIVQAGTHEQAVVKAANDLIKSGLQFDVFDEESPTHKIFVLLPAPNTRRQAAILKFGSNHLCGMVARAYAQHSNVVQLAFYRTICGHPWFGSLAGKIYDIHILLWFQHSQDKIYWPCTGADSTFPQLQLPACPGNLKFFTKVEELKEIKEPESGCPLCVVPTSATFPSFDAFVITDDAIITLQITISDRPDATQQGFQDLHKNLPANLLAKRSQRYHIFITEEEDNANELREQNLAHIPDNTCVYSAVIPVEDLGSVPVTEERVAALERAREPPSDKMEMD